MSGNKIELPADLRAKIWEDACKSLSPMLRSMIDRGAACSIANNVALRAAALAVEHMKEPVCEYCGSHDAPPNAVCAPGANYCIDNTKITRAQYEFERRKETK